MTFPADTPFETRRDEVLRAVHALIEEAAAMVAAKLEAGECAPEDVFTVVGEVGTEGGTPFYYSMTISGTAGCSAIQLHEERPPQVPGVPMAPPVAKA